MGQRTNSDTFHLSVLFDNHNEEPAFSLEAHQLHDYDDFSDKRGTLARWGTPILDGRILKAQELMELLDGQDARTLARRLDSGFLIIHFDRRHHRLLLINDRLASLPFFHTIEAERFSCSSSFKRLFDACGAVNSAQLDPWTVLEFLYFRRVFGNRTYDSAIHFLPYASILTVDSEGRLNKQRYWQPTCEKIEANEDELAEQLASAIQNSVSALMSDNRQYGLMLSGGLDARAILAASQTSPVCFTTSPKENNEVDVARELARLRGAEHIYLPRPEQLLNNQVDASIQLGGGMTVYSEAQFMGYGEQIGNRADTYFLGLALDIMFCGHYLAKSNVRLANRDMWHFRVDSLPSDMAGYFLDNVSYRLKTSSPYRVVRKELHHEYRERMRMNIEAEIQEGSSLGFSGHDLWEYLHLHNLARHYSFQMAQSIRTFGACRIPAVSNSIYDLCWSMCAEDKANWRVYQKAISRLNPALMQVRNANTNIRADRSLWQQSAIKVFRAASRRLPGISTPATPSWWERSWPHPRDSIDSNPRIKNWINKLPTSDRLEALGVFDSEALANVVQEHELGKYDHTVLLNLLLTIDRSLRTSEN